MNIGTVTIVFPYKGHAALNSHSDYVGIFLIVISVAFSFSEACVEIIFQTYSSESNVATKIIKKSR